MPAGSVPSAASFSDVDQLALGLLQLSVHLVEPLIGGGELLGAPAQFLLRRIRSVTSFKLQRM